MQNKYRFLSPNYKELAIDQTLLRLENPSIQPGFRDERNCFVFWARPPNHIIRLATKVQEILQKAAQGIQPITATPNGLECRFLIDGRCMADAGA